jgi:DNA polymerase-3 subunit delta'
MPFADILGQDRALSQLRLAVSDGRLSQAYCFFGPPGVGKHATALALAQAANCMAGPSRTRGAAGADACGTCIACQKVAAGLHPDVTEVRPEGKTVITIEQVREMTARAALRAYEGKTKIFILDPAELMQEPAANAILKTLEEPPGASLFILVTAAPSALLPTIVSRCQSVRFDPLGEGALRDILVRHGRTPEEAAAIAALASGSAGRALALDGEEIRATRERIVRQVWGGLGSPVSILECAEALAPDRAKLEEALEILAGFSRDLAVVKVGGAAAPLIPADRRSEAAPLAAGCSLGTILAFHRAQVEALRALARNANPRFIAERLLLRMRQAVAEGQEGGHASHGAR